jgi:hypothetical protein
MAAYYAQRVHFSAELSALHLTIGTTPLVKYFFVWCFWWVSVSYDSLKLNWFCLTMKLLHMAHIIFSHKNH